MSTKTDPLYVSLVHYRLGDGKFKPDGVTPEPEVKRRVLTGSLGFVPLLVSVVLIAIQR